MDDSSKFALGLRLATGYNNQLYFKLLKAFGDAASAWHADSASLTKVFKTSHSIYKDEFIKARKSIDLDLISEKLQKKGIGFIVFGNDDYPELLANISSPPPILFTRGNCPEKLHGLGVAIVGARRSTGYGRDIAMQFATELGQQNITVVSGLARGIDSAAHKGALESPGGTVAVLGCGVDRCYPPENHYLADQIAAQGVLVSEYPPGTAPLAKHFPARNRIISGISEAVVIVEADIKSGAMITANTALEQGREVFAVPGNIKNMLSRGPHKLIREGAGLAESAQDILMELGVVTMQKPETEEILTGLDDFEQKVFDQVGFDLVHIDDIIGTSGFSSAQVAGILTILEVKGLLFKDSGNYWQRR